jgi:hypothetical protein
MVAMTGVKDRAQYWRPDLRETANFEVTVDAARGIAVFGPGVETRSGEESRTLSATMLRDFAIISGRGLR